MRNRPKQKSPTGSKPKGRNQLWLTRKRLGLRQKQVAFLLQHKTTDQISRYEKGSRTPSLKVLLQLEIIYGVPVRVLYREYYEQLRAEILGHLNRSQIISAHLPLPFSEAELLGEFCSWQELLRQPRLSEPEKIRLRQHVVQLMKLLAYK